LQDNADVDLDNLDDDSYDKFVDARRQFYEELRKAVLDKRGLVS
jgi:DNA-binding SARP family transcriptional activator